MEGKHLNPFQHALARPDTYIGSCKSCTREMTVIEDSKPIFKEVFFNNGLSNIVKEAGSNCIDNSWRSKKAKIPMTKITVTYDRSVKSLTFWNDGKFIPVEKANIKYTDHKTGKEHTNFVYPAEVYFGEMFAGTNLDDTVERKTSGRNGMGVTILNVFSKEFTIRHTDSNVGKQFLQVYSENATKRTIPKITSFKNKIAFTEITFIPDFEKFKFDIENEEYETDFLSWVEMYCVEIAGIIALPVTFSIVNNEEGEEQITEYSKDRCLSPRKSFYEKIYHFKTFDKYVKFLCPRKNILITLPNGDECVIIENVNEDEELPPTLDNVSHVSFVNGCKTADGGIHVSAWRDAIFPTFVRAFNARKTNAKKDLSKVSLKDVYPYITLYIRTEIDKPSFDQQYKDKLNGPSYFVFPPGNKSATQNLKEEFETTIQKLLKWDFVKLLEEKLLAVLPKSKAVKSKKRPNFGDKVQDANLAGTGLKKEPENCICWFGEGDSAKALIERGISTLPKGQDYNGVIAIRGKFPNAREKTSKILKNNEFQILSETLNIRIGVKYDVPSNFKTLRYQKGIRFATDMDDDGIHIRGLLINFFYFYWPELFNMGFVSSLSTAVCKVNKKSESILANQDSHRTSFQSIPFYCYSDFKEWCGEDGNSKNIDVKYIKGLGQINPKDAPGYFNDPKIVEYFEEGDEAQYIQLGFDYNTKFSDQRKKWVVRDIRREKDYGNENGKNSGESEETIDIEDYVYDGELSISAFIDNQLIIYHKTALERALPHLIDGLKKGQRKVLYGIRKKNYKKTYDLEKVSGAIKELTGYHHGAVSLTNTIVNMAQKFPGSNNIALLNDDGEFGTRTNGGSDHAAPRYLSTMLEDITKIIFPSIDDNILSHVMEDNEEAEFTFFIPIICMLLINGAKGIAGGGFATDIPNYHPLKILEWTRTWIADPDKCEELERLVPWYRGIDGPIDLEITGNVERARTKGIIKECGKGCDVVREHLNGKNKIVKEKCKGYPGWYHILDLPVGVWTSSFMTYIDYLESGQPPPNTKWKKLDKPLLQDRNQYNTANRVYTMIKPIETFEPTLENMGRYLTATKPLTNMVTIDSNGYPTRYSSPEEILKTWCPKRLYFYKKRYDYILSTLNIDLEKAQNKYRFVKMIREKKLNMNRKKADIEAEMEELKFKKFLNGKKNNSTEDEEKDDEKEEKSEDGKENNKNANYKYLFVMQIVSMTAEKLEKLKREEEAIKKKIGELQQKTPKDLWLEDLNAFEQAWKAYEKLYPLY